MSRADMGKVWVLDTETKGTGATMVPLEQTLRKASAEPDLELVEWERPPRPAKEPEARPARRFRIVDLRSRRILGDRLDARATVELLGGVETIVDVHVHVWEPTLDRWRLLTLDEQRSLWRLRGRIPDAA
jgi:hypothetical protein